MYLAEFVIAVFAMKILLGALAGRNAEFLHHCLDSDDEFGSLVIVDTGGNQRSDLVHPVPGHIPFFMSAEKAGYATFLIICVRSGVLVAIATTRVFWGHHRGEEGTSGCRCLNHVCRSPGLQKSSWDRGGASSSRMLPWAPETDEVRLRSVAVAVHMAWAAEEQRIHR